MPDVQADAGRRAYLFSSQCGDAVFAAYLRAAGRAVQELHESRILGIHLAEFLAGVVGDDFAGDHAYLFFHEHLQFCVGAL